MSSSSDSLMENFSTISVGRFEKLQRLGEGTYGTVYRARDRETGEIVALKKLRMSREKSGFPLTSIREIRLLRSLDHPNIVKLKFVAVGRRADSIFLVFEYCLHDYATLIDRRLKPFTEGEVKSIMLQLLSSVDFLHSNFILHRDLKLSNLLFNAENQLKLADFGLARRFSNPLKDYTRGVCTLWYRSPELLLGSDRYHSGVDSWALGCIFAELLNNEPIMPGKSDPEQLEMICKLLGTPSEKIWPEFQYLKPKGTELPNFPFNNLAEKFPNLSESGLNLLSRFLTYDPSKRITAAKALAHPYFTEAPLPVPVSEIDHRFDENNQGKSIETEGKDETEDSDDEIEENEIPPPTGGKLNYQVEIMKNDREKEEEKRKENIQQSEDEEESADENEGEESIEIPPQKRAKLE